MSAAGPYVDVMMSFIREAGEVALSLIENSASELKKDHSVITKADLAISALAHERLAPFIKAGGHVLIDEEDPKRGAYLDDDFLNAHPFVWSLDPIDATRAYANRMPHYGISIGLIKERRPWLGAVYFPSLGELFYCDGQDAWFIRRAFTPQQTREKIVPVDEVITSRSVFIVSDVLLTRFRWVSKECTIMMFAAAVCEFCWPLIGRGCGSLSKVHLWDMAGAWPIFEKAGMKMRAYSDGRPLERLETGLFHGGETPWKFKEYYILSSERNFPVLKESLQSV